MPLSDVASLSVRKTQVAATTALVVVTAGLLAFVIALSQADFGY